MTTATKERKSKKQTAGGISLSVAELKAALNAVQPAVPARSPRQVFQNVLLSGGVLSGSDGDLRIDVTLENAPPGINVLLPMGRFSQIVRSATCDEIELIPNGTTCIVRAGHGEWTLPTEDPAEYPEWSVSATKPLPRIPADQFVRAVKGTVYCVEAKSSRYALGGVMVDVVRGEGFTFVATDGRRLSLYAADLDGQDLDNSETLIPARAMAIMAAIAAEVPTQAVELEATSSAVVATIGNAVVTARLVDGRFPPWRDVVPRRDAKPTTVARAALLAATSAAAIVTSESSKGVDYTFGSTGIWLHGQSAEAGESSVTCNVVDSGESCIVKLNPKFVAEWLNGIAPDEEPNVYVEAVDGKSAAVFRCGNDEEQDTYTYTGVIMPLADD